MMLQKECLKIFSSFLLFFTPLYISFSGIHQYVFPDTLVENTETTDTFFLDTLQNDLPQVDAPIRERDRQTGVDTVVVYSASDSVVYNVLKRELKLYNDGYLKYRNMELRAARITFDWNRSELYAEGVPADTIPDGKTTGRGLKQYYHGLPVMRDGPEEYEGFTMAYNFNTRRGRMTLTDTEIERGHYHGKTVKKMENDVLYLADGWYTTCDNPDHPHFYFFSPRMRVVPKSSVAAAPIYLYIADVPIFVIPFGVFPSQSGRRSGLLTPTYGESALHGRFLTGIGYYWAINDYMDWRGSFDWFSKGRWKLDSNLRYNLRYYFTGSLLMSTSFTARGEPGDPQRTEQRDYQIFWMHSQEIDPTSRLDVNFNYMSSDYYHATSLDFHQLQQQNIISNATYTKRWERSNNSMSINVNRDHNIRTDEVSWLLPNISFNRTTSYPFRRDQRQRSPGQPYKWYELIGYTYSSNAQHRFSTMMKDVAAGDSTLVEDRSLGINHRVNVSASQREGYITYSPFFNYTEYWYNERDIRWYEAELDTVLERTETGFFPVRFFTMGISLQTTLYGMFQPRIGNIVGIRHTMSPNITYNFRPDFGTSWWGYYDSYFDPIANQHITYSPYQRQLFGSAPRGEQQQISFSIANQLEMKTVSRDETQEEKKYQLLNFNISSAYNFAADSLRFSDILINYRTSIGGFSISGGSSFSLYAFDRSLGRTVDRFQYSETGSLIRLLEFNMSVSTSLRGGSSAAIPYNYEFYDLVYPMNPYNYQRRAYYYHHEPRLKVPWDISLSWNFGYSERDPRNIGRRSSVRGGLTLNLTEKWQVRASSGYDIITGKFTDPLIVVTRDLHCWEMHFTWVPTGFNQHYRFEVRVKAPHLQDLKVTKRGSVREVY